MNETELQIQSEPELIEIKDNSQRVKTLLIVFWVLIVIIIIGIFTGLNELQILQKAQIGDYVTEETAKTSDLLQLIVGLSQFSVYIVSIVVFLNWFRRAYGNLHRLGVNNLQHKETMAVWAWFIPIIWFFRPVQIMKEIWTETQEKIRKFDSSYVIKSGGFIIGLWWTLYIVSNFLGRYVLKAAFKQDTIEQIIESSKASMISDILSIPEALVVILIVYKLSKMESKLADEVKKANVDMDIANSEHEY